MKKRLLSLLLTICLVAGLVPTVVIAADGDKAIMSGTSGIKDPTATPDDQRTYYVPNSYIYFGVNGGTPIKWRVLNADKANDESTNGVFLLSEYLLASGIASNQDGSANEGQQSYAQEWCKNFASNLSNFSQIEQSAMLGVAKTDSEESLYGWEWGESSLTREDKMFFLSARELFDYVANFSYTYLLQATFIGSESDLWGLRSPVRENNSHVGVVSTFGEVLNSSFTGYESFAARPAFNLDPNSVLFTSAAEGGKSADGMDSGLTAIGNYEGNEWKLTILDESRNFGVTEQTAVGIPGDTITLNYTAATVGTNEYISAIIADESGIQYYGRVMQPSTENGTVNVTIPSGLAAGKYTLNVFSEQCNGDYKTDYASEFEQITLTVEEVPAPKQDKAITLGTNGIKDPTAEGNTYYIPNSYIYFGVNDGTPIKWRVLDADKANDKSTDGIFLLSEYLLSSGVYFNKEKTSNFWQNTCTASSVCSVCGQPYGSVDSTNHTGSEAWTTTETSHTKVWSCCQAVIEGPAEHTWENGECTVCGYPCQHTGGTATCSQLAQCERCGTLYGDYDETNHDPADEWTQENGKHYHICQYGCGTHLDEADCSGGTATCTEPATCDVCGNAYGNALGHDFSGDFDAYDEDGHWHICNRDGCNETDTPQSHSFTTYSTNNDATCTDDGTETAKCDYCEATDTRTDAGSATGHDWDEPVWNWSQDGKTCTVTFTCQNDSSHTEQPEVNVTSEVTVPATCTDDGTTTYTASIELNGQTYKDSKDVADNPATGHKLTKIESKAATCTEEGYTGDEVCKVCGEVVEQGKTIPKLAHNYQDGRCSECGAIDGDFQPAIIAGANGEWQKGTKDGLSFTSNAAFADFLKVQIDGKDLDASNYDVEEGSTIVTLKASYLETLSVGKHTLAIVSETGTAATEFTVKAAAASDDIQPPQTGDDQTGDSDNSGTSTGDTVSPQTGDSSNVVLWVSLLFASGVGLFGAAVYSRKRKYSK